MKRWTIKTIFISTLAGILLTGVGCNNNKDRGNTTVANMGVLPTINCLLSPNNSQGFCNYPYGNYYGFTNYQHTLAINGLNNNYATGFCGCGDPSTSYPIYNNNWGLGCVKNADLPRGYGNAVNFLMFTWNSQGRQWTNYQNYQNNYAWGGSGASCPTYSVILACDMGVQGSCGPNGSCMSLNRNGTTGGGTYVVSEPGICVMNQQRINNGYPYYSY